jgi:hypothetical protein
MVAQRSLRLRAAMNILGRGVGNLGARFQRFPGPASPQIRDKLPALERSTCDWLI